MITKLQDNYLDRIIAEKLEAENKEQDEKRKPSGKLSASKLWWPLQWQILATQFGLTSKIDDYTRRKFQRGKDVENWFISQIETKETQKFLEYKEVIGYCDSIVDTKNWDNNVGIIPLEIKSITNAKFKWLEKGEPNKGHVIQNALYALAMKSEYHAIAYIASDDYRISVSIFKTKDSEAEINQIIDDYQKAIKDKIIPVFKAREKWQENIKYNSFPDVAGMSELELKELYKELKTNNK